MKNSKKKIQTNFNGQWYIYKKAPGRGSPCVFFHPPYPLQNSSHNIPYAYSTT